MGAPEQPRACGWDLALARLVLAGIFLFAAYFKLTDPESFGIAIEKFEIVRDRRILEWLAFIVPSVEAVCGVALVLGFWGRAAALVLFAMLLGFAGALISVIARGMEIECQCFGDYFGGDVDWTSVARNVVFMAVAAPVMVRGSGLLSLDRATGRRRARASEAEAA